jgi:hypothetical protein
LMAVSDVSGWWFGTWMFFSISLIYSDMGCHHPSHWRTPSFFKMIIAPPTRCFWCWFEFCSRICLVISWWFDVFVERFCMVIWLRIPI